MEDLPPAVQKRVDDILAQARVETPLPDFRVATVMGIFVGIATLAALAIVWTQYRELRNPALFLVALIPFGAFLFMRRGLDEGKATNVFRIEIFPMWLAVEGAIGGVFGVGVIGLVVALLLDLSAPRLSELLMKVTLFGCATAIGGLLLFFFVFAFRARVAVDSRGVREYRLFGSAGAEWSQIRSVELEPAFDSAVREFLWPLTVILRAVLRLLRRRGLLADEVRRVKVIHLLDGGKLRFRLITLMSDHTAARMTAEIVRQAIAVQIPVSDPV